MPDLLVRPRPTADVAAPAVPDPPPLVRPRSRVVAGAVAAGYAAGLGLIGLQLLVVAIWASEARSTAGFAAALRTGAVFWLLAHGTVLHLPDAAGLVHALPLGLTLVFLLLLRRAGRSIALRRPSRQRGRTVMAATAAVALPYAVLVTLLAGLTAGTAGSSGAEPSVPSALVGGLAVGGLGAGWGAWQAVRVPGGRQSVLAAVLTGAKTGLLALLAVSALAAGIALAVNLPAAVALARPARVGVVGGFGLFVLQAAIVPNFLVWAGAYLIGPGFAVGTSTSVSLLDGRLGELPALPALVALPGHAPAVARLLLVVPALTGVLAGVVVARRPPVRLNARHAAAVAAGVGPVAAVVGAAAAALSGGAVSDGRLSVLGASPWQVALVLGAEYALAAGGAAAFVVARRDGGARLRLPRTLPKLPHPQLPHPKLDRLKGHRPSWWHRPSCRRPSWLRLPELRGRKRRREDEASR